MRVDFRGLESGQWRRNTFQKWSRGTLITQDPLLKMVTDADSVLKSGFMIIWESCPDEMSLMAEKNAKYTVH